MLRRLFLGLFCVAGMASLTLATEVTLVKYDKTKKEVTVKEKDSSKDVVYKLTEQTKYLFIDAEGKESKGDLTAAEKTLNNEKAQGKAKIDITVEKDTITAVKFKSRKKKV